MTQLRRMMVIFAFVSMVILPLPSQALPLGFDTEILLLLSGPVSEAVQETVLLIRRGDNFVSKDSLTIGCIAGGSAGLMVGVAPMLGFIDTTVGAPVGISYVMGTVLLSCVMAMASSAAGMGTMWSLSKWREWRDAPPVPSQVEPKIQPNNDHKLKRRDGHRPWLLNLLHM